MRRLSLSKLIAVVLVASLFVGVLAHRLSERQMQPLDRARALVRAGQYAEAERSYLELAKKRPVSLPVLVELVDVHRVSGVIDDAAVDAVLGAPDLQHEVTLLAAFWSDVVQERPAVAQDRAAVAALADRDPPAPWANHLLGREAKEDGKDDEAADRFAREASSFADRREDADVACRIWAETSNWERMRVALGRPTFAHQVSASVRMDEAIRTRDWRSAAWLFFPCQYEGATWGVVVLASISALVWFAICAQVGLVGERPSVRVPLYLAAFLLGVGSTYVALAFALIEQAFGFEEKGQVIADAIYYVVGVGLREELAKTLLLLPLVPIIVRAGRRREALACGALVGLGFAAEENIGYFHMGLSTALTRFLTANFLHVSATGLVAVALDDWGRGRRTDEGGLSRTLALAVVAHGAYDFFLSSGPVGDGSFLSMLVFVLLTRRFVDVLRDLPGREKPLLRWFCGGLAVVAGASFVYASARVGPGQAALALLEGALGVAIVTFFFVQELRNL